MRVPFFLHISKVTFLFIFQNCYTDLILHFDQILFLMFIKNVDGLAIINSFPLFMATLLDFKMTFFFLEEFNIFCRKLIPNCKMAFCIFFVLYEVYNFLLFRTYLEKNFFFSIFHVFWIYLKGHLSANTIIFVYN